MANFKIKRLPPIRLVDLLKKRKTNLKEFLETYGIVAYSTLIQKCNKMGVSPPDENEFKKIISVSNSSPQEGVVVLDSPLLTKENTGEAIFVDDMGNIHAMTSSKDPVPSQEKSLKKKEEKKPQIDESIFVMPVEVSNFENSGSELGEQTSVDDDLDSSISKLSTLKNSK